MFISLLFGVADQVMLPVDLSCLLYSDSSYLPY
jgi:hypothetical protein